MIWLALLPASIAVLYVLWVAFLAVMNLKHARDNGKLTNVAHWFGMPLLLTGYILDAVVNISVMTFLFMELPREMLVTTRLSRHIHDADGWRKSMACWFGYNLLNPFDPSGTHLK